MKAIGFRHVAHGTTFDQQRGPDVDFIQIKRIYSSKAFMTFFAKCVYLQSPPNRGGPR